MVRGGRYGNILDVKLKYFGSCTVSNIRSRSEMSERIDARVVSGG